MVNGMQSRALVSMRVEVVALKSLWIEEEDTSIDGAPNGRLDL